MAKKHHKHLDYDSYKRDYDAYLKEQRQKKREPVMKALRPLLIVILLLALGIGVYYVMSNPDVLTFGTPNSAPEEEAPEETAPSAENTQEAVSKPVESEPEAPQEPITFTAGEYTADVDFPAGRYVLTTEEEECQFVKPGQDWTLRRGDDGYTCTFEPADYLKCAGKLTLTPVENYEMPEEPEETEDSVSAAPVEKHDDGSVTLYAGDYFVGEDFPAGRYTITTESAACSFSAEEGDGSFDGIFALLTEGDGGYTGTLENGYQVHCSGTVLLTPYDP